MAEKKAISRIYKPLRHWVNRTIVNSSLVGDPPVYDPAIFPWTRILEENWQGIRDEAMGVWKHWEAIPPMGAVVPQTYKITTDDTWRCFFLYCYGERINQNCGRAALTARLVEQIPGLSMALFSYHKPGLHIPAHVGVTKFFLTCHLGLQVPTEWEKCRIRVDHQVLNWREGKTIVFDDMANHEVWNDTEDYRAILMLQFARPVKAWGRLVGNAFRLAIRFSPIGDEVRDRLETWDEKYKKAESQTDGASPGKPAAV
jgi:beta-hydroxylase